jgi:hypothetical protein
MDGIQSTSLTLYGVLLKYCRKRYMDEPDWLLELFIVPVATDRKLHVVY